MASKWSLLFLLASAPWSVLAKAIHRADDVVRSRDHGPLDATNVSEYLEEDIVSNLEDKLALLTRDAALFEHADTGVVSRWQANSLQTRQTDNSAELAEQLSNLMVGLESLLQFLTGTGPSQSTSDPSTPTTALPEQMSSETSTVTESSTVFATDVTTASSLAASSSILPITAPTSTSSTTGSTHTFDPMASDLNIVYYAQTDQTNAVPLSQICQDSNIDVVILAFVTSFFGPGGYPIVNFGPKCWASNTNQSAAGATGLLDCVSDGFAAQVSGCQSLGKKVMLSLGGAISDTEIPSDTAAQELANTLWNLFLGGTSNTTTSALRPFGPDIILDGIDIDNESPSNAAHIPALATALRTLYSTSSNTKQYYLSAAPECPLPSLSIPIPSLLPHLDFISVQFYNNPSCNLDSGSSFLDSLTSWSQALAQTHDFVDVGNGVSDGPRLLVGVPAFTAGGSGFVDVAGFRSVLGEVKGLGLGNVAGVTFWDGAYEEESGSGGGGGGETYASAVKEVLGA